MKTRKNLNNFLLMLVFSLATLCTAAAGGTLYVNTDGSGGAFTSIQTAIEAAANGDEIEVAPGKYNETINFNGKAVRLYSRDGAADTTIDGGGGGTNYVLVVQCRTGEGADTILEGFTITGGNGQYYGGGMYNGNNSSPTVIDCIFTGNYSLWGGAGMINWESSPTVTGCTFSDNSSANWGGAMFTQGSSPTVTDCIFSGNSAGHDGGGYGGAMYNWSHEGNPCSPTITDCAFSGNSAGRDGGVMYNDASTPTVTDCTFSGNSADNNSGGGIYNNAASIATVTDCAFTGNSAGTNGGGLRNYNSDSMVTGCIFSNNSAGSTGGGMSNHLRNPTVINATFSGNSTTSGGGMYNSDSSPTVTNCTFSGNSASSHGGGMFNSGSDPTISNCTFNANSAGSNSGDGRGGGMYNLNNSSPTIAGCTFSSNVAYLGGGMSNKDDSSPTVTDCVFTDNSITTKWGGGGGMRNDKNCSPTVIGCTFSRNSASYDGGGMRNQSNSNPTVTGCMFNNNSTEGSGGGMSNAESNPEVTNCTFSGNSATHYGGGMQNSDSSPMVTNCTFTGNSALNSAGGMRNRDSSPTVTNCTFTGNSAGSCGGMRNDTDSSTTANNCIFWDDTPNEICLFGSGSTLAISYSDVQGGTGQPWFGTGCIDTDPFFADSNGRLSPWSPCINAGDNSAVAGVATDLDGNPRIFNGIVSVVDMGAFECQVEQDSVIGSAGGTVEDNDGTGASFSVDPGVLPGDISIYIDVLPDPGVDPQAGFAAIGMYFVDITLNPNPSPLPSPGATITLPLSIPLSEGTTLSLFKYDPDTGALVNTGIVGTVDPGGATATFTGVTDFSIFAGFQDVAPPQINSISANPNVLWPANHKIVEVTVEVDATDNSGSEPFCSILGVDSNESINGPGDGNTEPDWDYTGDLTVNLRAERAGSGNGRVYTIIVECTDASGNTTMGEVEVTVPHDQGKGKGKDKDEGKGKGKK